MEIRNKRSTDRETYYAYELDGRDAGRITVPKGTPISVLVCESVRGVKYYTAFVTSGDVVYSLTRQRYEHHVAASDQLGQVAGHGRVLAFASKASQMPPATQDKDPVELTMSASDIGVRPSYLAPLPKVLNTSVLGEVVRLVSYSDPEEDEYSEGSLYKGELGDGTPVKLTLLDD